MDLKKLQEIVIAFRTARNWKQAHTARNSMLALFMEAGELAQLLQWRNEDEFKAFLKSPKNKEAVADELVDVLYWVLIMSNDFGVDLENEFMRKMKKNAQKYPVKK